MNSISISDLKYLVKQAREVAIREARQVSPVYRSRGTFLCTSGPEGQTQPAPEAEAQNWDGTMKSIKDLVDDVRLHYPQTNEVYIAGGYDGFEEKRDLFIPGADYYPQISLWEVTVWKRDSGYVSLASQVAA